jgi:D-alanine transaminase
VREAKTLPLQMRNQGVKVILHEDERWANCYIKSLNLLPNILAKQTAHEAGGYEAILVRNGFITEGSSSNVFMVKDSRVFTTPLSKAILPGITRLAVKRVCQTLSIDFVEQHFTPEELLQADEVFITSTTAEILPIVLVDNQEIGWGKPGDLTRKLFDQLQQVIAE